MKAQIVSFHCIVKDKMGRVLSSTYNQDVLTYDEKQKDVMAGLARGLQDLKKGEKRRIALSASEAYGFYDPKQVMQCSKAQLPRRSALNLGDQVVLASRDGGEQLYRVTEVTADQVTLDANHPFAGQDLVFEIETTAARAATPEDLGEDDAVGAREMH